MGTKELLGGVTTFRDQIECLVLSSSDRPSWIRLHPYLHVALVKQVDGYDPSHFSIRSIFGIPVRVTSDLEYFFEGDVAVGAQIVWEERGWISRVANLTLPRERLEILGRIERSQ